MLEARICGIWRCASVTSAGDPRAVEGRAAGTRGELLLRQDEQRETRRPAIPPAGLGSTRADRRTSAAADSGFRQVVRGGEDEPGVQRPTNSPSQGRSPRAAVRSRRGPTPRPRNIEDQADRRAGQPAPPSNMSPLKEPTEASRTADVRSGTAPGCRKRWWIVSPAASGSIANAPVELGRHRSGSTRCGKARVDRA